MGKEACNLPDRESLDWSDGSSRVKRLCFERKFVSIAMGSCSISHIGSKCSIEEVRLFMLWDSILFILPLKLPIFSVTLPLYPLVFIFNV